MTRLESKIIKHLVDTSPRLAECNRCHNYVLAGMHSGLKYAVDMTPLNPATTRALILGGVTIYRAHHNKISMLTPASMDYKGLRFARHGCGCMAIDSNAFEERDIPPLPAPAPEELAVFERQGLTCSVVTDVRPRRSDVVRCAHCKELIDHDEERIMIETPVWQHSTLKVPNRGSRKGYTRDYEGWGYTRWATHTGGCHANTSTNAT